MSYSVKTTKKNKKKALKQNPKKRKKERVAYKKITFPIIDMDCLTCAFAIEKDLLSAYGIKSAGINFGLGKATVEYEKKKISLKEIEEIIKNSGYTAILPI